MLPDVVRGESIVNMSQIKHRTDVANPPQRHRRVTGSAIWYYITAALKTGDADFVRDSLGIVAKARGMSQVAKTADLNRESLYKALSETGNPEFSTVMRVIRALGLTLAARPAETKRTPKRRRAA